MKKLLFIALLAASMSVSAQQTKSIADETYIRTAKKSFKVCTANEKIFKLVMAKFPDVTRYTVIKKKDRVGEYWEKEISFDIEELTKVETYLKSL